MKSLFEHSFLAPTNETKGVAPVRGDDRHYRGEKVRIPVAVGIGVALHLAMFSPATAGEAAVLDAPAEYVATSTAEHDGSGCASATDGPTVNVRAAPENEEPAPLPWNDKGYDFDDHWNRALAKLSSQGADVDELLERAAANVSKWYGSDK